MVEVNDMNVEGSSIIVNSDLWPQVVKW